MWDVQDVTPVSFNFTVFPTFFLSSDDNVFSKV